MKQAVSSGNACDLYLARIQFISQPGHCHEVFVVISSNLNEQCKCKCTDSCAEEFRSNLKEQNIQIHFMKINQLF